MSENNKPEEASGPVISATDGEVVTVAVEADGKFTVSSSPQPEPLLSSRKNSVRWLQLQNEKAMEAALAAVEPGVVGVVVIVVNRDPQARSSDGYGRFCASYNNLDLNTAYAVMSRTAVNFHIESM